MILSKITGYVKTFEGKDGNKDNKSISFLINDENLLGKYKMICTKIEDFENIKLNALAVYDGRYIKIKN